MIASIKEKSELVGAGLVPNERDKDNSVGVSFLLPCESLDTIQYLVPEYMIVSR